MPRKPPPTDTPTSQPTIAITVAPDVMPIMEHMARLAGTDVATVVNVLLALVITTQVKGKS